MFLVEFDVSVCVKCFVVEVGIIYFEEWVGVNWVFNVVVMIYVVVVIISILMLVYFFIWVGIFGGGSDDWWLEVDVG